MATAASHIGSCWLEEQCSASLLRRDCFSRRKSFNRWGFLERMSGLWISPLAANFPIGEDKAKTVP
jgi:hypothetical protein